jgi:hypothetical protein
MPSAEDNTEESIISVLFKLAPLLYWVVEVWLERTPFVSGQYLTSRDSVLLFLAASDRFVWHQEVCVCVCVRGGCSDATQVVDPAGAGACAHVCVCVCVCTRFGVLEIPFYKIVQIKIDQFGLVRTSTKGI